MITMQIQIDRQTDMLSWTDNYDRSLFTMIDHYSLARVNKFQIGSRTSRQTQTDVHKSLLFTSMRLLFISMHGKRLIDSQTNYYSSIVISTIFYKFSPTD